MLWFLKSGGAYVMIWDISVGPTKGFTIRVVDYDSITYIDTR